MDTCVLRSARAVAVLVVALASSVQAAVSTVRLATGLSRPVYVTAAPGDDTRLFVVEQHTGNIRIFDRGTNSLLATPFLNVTGLSTGNEQGLLGLAFDPGYAANGRFFVNYTDSGGTTRIAQYTRQTATTANPTGTVILSIAQPQSNHNGGWLGFGPDGKLYISSGDGGNANDTGTGHIEPGGNAQSASSLLGKMLRIDVSAGTSYSIPAGNPFGNEIWDYGLRNPWRASFDRQNGNLWIGDVGQGAREEIDFHAANTAGGVNFGWRIYEGNVTTGLSGPGGTINPVFPVFDYPRTAPVNQVSGATVTGGYVYRGPVSELQGQYFFADFGNARIWSIPGTGATVTSATEWTTALTPNAGTINLISSFGEDNAGNLYIVDLGGEVFQVVPEPATWVLLVIAAVFVGAWRRRRV